MRLMVGYDGSDGGRDALALTGAIGAVEDSSALVVAVMPYDSLPMAFTELERDAATDAEPLFEQARAALEGMPLRTRAFGGGSAAGVLTDLAEREKVDAVVVGSPHRGRLGRTVLGSVATGLLHGAPCPVAVAPRGYAGGGEGGGEGRGGPFDTIAVAYDGTPEAKAALLHGRRLAEACGAAAVVMTVVAPPVALPGAVGYTPVNPPEPQAIVDEGVRGMGPHLTVEGRQLAGQPAATLAQACEEGVDLLVVGSRGYGPVARVLLGSVSTRLICDAPCPVLVVPRPDEAEPAL